MSLTTVSLMLSWAAIIALTLVVVALARQIGILHERIAPAGALSIAKRNLRTGEAAPQFELTTLAGTTQQVGGEQPSGKSTLLFFLSETCPVCKVLLPVLRSVQRDESEWLDIVFASDGDAQVHRAFVQREKLESFNYLLSEELGRAFEIAKLPYGVLIDEQGTLLSHGLINNREHLESLVESRRLGVPTVQEYAAKNVA